MLKEVQGRETLHFYKLWRKITFPVATNSEVELQKSGVFIFIRHTQMRRQRAFTSLAETGGSYHGAYILNPLEQPVAQVRRHENGGFRNSESAGFSVGCIHRTEKIFVFFL